MKITNKAATVMFTGKNTKALAAQYLKDHLNPGRGASTLMKQSAHLNKSLVRIGQTVRETFRKIDGSESILLSPKVEQIIESIMTGRKII